MLNTVIATQTEQVKISDKDIVPEEYQNRLMYWRDRFTQGCFDIGDMANELIRRSAERGFKVPDKRIYKAVSRFCARQPRTIRYYSETSSFFLKEIRDEFDVLPFSFFVFARSCGADWRKVLEHASTQPDISLSALRYYFTLTEQFGETSQDNRGLPNSVKVHTAGQREVSSEEFVNKFGEVSQISGGAGDHLRLQFLSEVRVSMDALAGLVGHLKVDEQDKREVINAIGVINSSIPALSKAKVMV